MKTNETFKKKKKQNPYACRAGNRIYVTHTYTRTHANTHVFFCFFFLWNLICAVLEESLHGSVPRICGFQYKCLAGREVFSLWPAALQYQSLFHNNMLSLFSQHNAATAKPGPGARHIQHDSRRCKNPRRDLQDLILRRSSNAAARVSAAAARKSPL